MNQLESINIEIAKEKACIKDLKNVIAKHERDGRFDLKEERLKDIQRSNERIARYLRVVRISENITRDKVVFR